MKPKGRKKLSDFVKLYLKSVRTDKEETMKQVNKFLGLVGLTVFLFSILVMSSVSAAPSTDLDLPAASSTVSGTIGLNATITNPDSNFSCGFYAKSSLTANDTWSLLATIANATDITANTTYDTIGLEDANNYIFNATCYNDTTTWADDTNIAIVIDNTVPQTPSSLSPATDSVDKDGSVTFSSTVTGENTTSCTLYFSEGNPGASSYAMTHTSNTCSYSLTNIPEQTYKWYVIASDETNSSSASAINRINVDIQTSAGKAVLLAQAEREGLVKRTGLKTFAIVNGFNKTIAGIPIWIILVLGGIVVGIVIYVKKKG